MSKEIFFTDVIIRYKKLLLTPEGKNLTLRDYCKARHVVYRDFIKWASTSKDAIGLPEIAKIVKVKKKSSKPSVSVNTSSVGKKAQTPHLYPLQILDTSCSNELFAPMTKPETSNMLRGIRIILPCGTSISIREGSGLEIAHIIHSVNS